VHDRQGAQSVSDSPTGPRGRHRLFPSRFRIRFFTFWLRMRLRHGLKAGRVSWVPAYFGIPSFLLCASLVPHLHASRSGTSVLLPEIMPLRRVFFLRRDIQLTPQSPTTMPLRQWSLSPPPKEGTFKFNDQWLPVRPGFFFSGHFLVARLLPPQTGLRREWTFGHFLGKRIFFFFFPIIRGPFGSADRFSFLPGSPPFF